MGDRTSISVRIQGLDYRIASDGDPESVEQVQAAAALVDETMAKIHKRSGTVDSVSVAVLAALNLAHRAIALREAEAARERVDPERVRALIELVESTTGSAGRA